MEIEEELSYYKSLVEGLRTEIEILKKMTVLEDSFNSEQELETLKRTLKQEFQQKCQTEWEEVQKSCKKYLRENTDTLLLRDENQELRDKIEKIKNVLNDMDIYE